jgi:hypothetical protein
MIVLSAGIRSLLWNSQRRGPESASRGTCHPGQDHPGMVGDIISNGGRNYLGMGGRHHSGIMGGLLRNPHPHRLDRACICSQLPKLPDKESSHRGHTEGSTSSSVEEQLGFWIDEAAKTVVLADGTPLTVHRFDDRWISAARGDMSYELERQNGNLTYASSTMKDGAATITIGSGRCEIAAGPAG